MQPPDPPAHDADDAWDCHMHAYPAAAPLAPTAPGPPPAGADAAAYRRARGAGRALVVQPSHYGRDNGATLAAAAALGGAAVIVLALAEATEAVLAAHAAAGAVGVRFHMARSPAVAWADLPGLAERIAPLGWHVSVQLDGPALAEALPLLRRLPAPVVVEHFGRPANPADADDPAVRAVSALLEGGRGWVKLSAPYMLAADGCDPHAPAAAALARRYAALAPGRVLWGSNWPHPNRGSLPAPDMRALAALPAAWFGAGSPRAAALLHDNPAALLAPARARLAPPSGAW
jgi:D-galactarolactone isomerase